jgi:hypothetical protein
MNYGILGEFEKLGTPNKITIQSIKDKTKARFLFSFRAERRPVEIVMSSRDAMRLMQALEAFQAKHKFPIPRRPWATGKPTLRLVGKGED